MAEDDGQFYFRLEDLVRELPDRAISQIGNLLTSNMTDRSWRALGDFFGYTMSQMDTFEQRPNAGYNLLRDWATKDRSTIRVLEANLKRIERFDVVSKLDNVRENPIILDVVIHDPEFSGTANESFNTEVRGRKKLWKGLLPVLEKHVKEVDGRGRYSFFKLRNSHERSSWQDECNIHQGQQLDIDVSHGNDQRVSNSDAEVLAPSWHLLTRLLLLRYTRNSTTGSTAETKVPQSDATNKPEIQRNCPDNENHGSLPSGYESSGNFIWNQESQSLVLKTLRSNTGSHGCREVAFNEPRDLVSSLSGGGLRKDQELLVAEDTDYSIGELDLRSSDSLSQDSLKRTVQTTSHRSPTENADSNMFEQEQQTTICIRTDLSSMEGSEAAAQRELEASVVVKNRVVLSMSSPTPEESLDSDLDLRESDPDLENESVWIEEEGSSCKVVYTDTATNDRHRLQRRRVYYQPDSDTIRKQFPELWNLPGFHPTLKHRKSLIKATMRPYDDVDGLYLLRVFSSDDDHNKVQVALTMTYKSKLKHFKILHHQDSNRRLYFLFNRDFEAISISELIDYYKSHPLVPRGFVYSGINQPILQKPIIAEFS